jgi:hypothetical protein
VCSIFNFIFLYTQTTPSTTSKERFEEMLEFTKRVNPAAHQPLVLSLPTPSTPRTSTPSPSSAQAFSPSKSQTLSMSGQLNQSLGASRNGAMAFSTNVRSTVEPPRFVFGVRKSVFFFLSFFLKAYFYNYLC